MQNHHPVDQGESPVDHPPGRITSQWTRENHQWTTPPGRITSQWTRENHQWTTHQAESQPTGPPTRENHNPVDQAESPVDHPPSRITASGLPTRQNHHQVDPIHQLTPESQGTAPFTVTFSYCQLSILKTTRSTGTVHTSTKAHITSVTIRMDLDRQQNLTIC